MFDDAILAGAFNRPNRTGFLLESLADLDARAAVARRAARRPPRRLGRRGRPARRERRRRRPPSTSATTSARTRAPGSHGSRPRRVPRASTSHRAPGITIVEPGAVTPGDAGDHYKVFTPYYRRWSDVRRRAVVAAPAGDRPPARRRPRCPARRSPTSSTGAPLARRRARAVRRPPTQRLDAWVERDLRTYADRHDDLPGDATSRLSPYLHFGCVSPLEVRARRRAAQGSRRVPPAALLARLLPPDPRRPPRRRVVGLPAAAATAGATIPTGSRAWQEGCTGYPVVDAAMRQLRAGRVRCTTGPAWSWRRSSPRTSTSTGAPAPATSSTSCSTATSPTTTSTGSGSPAPAPTPTRTACSTRPCRAPASTPTATTCGATCPSSRAVKGGAVHDPEPKVRRAYDYPDPIVDHREADRRVHE